MAHPELALLEAELLGATPKAAPHLWRGRGSLEREGLIGNTGTHTPMPILRC